MSMVASRVSSSTAVFLLSLLGIPITYFVNNAVTLTNDFGLLVAGVLSLAVVLYLAHVCVSRPGQKIDALFYVFMLGTFSSVVDFIIALENDGIVYGFMTKYLKNGEPYLKTSYGTMLCYWDGMAHYGMYLMMLSAKAWNQGFRDVGLYWTGSIINSLLVLLPGSVIGKYGIQYAFLLNLPYVIIPVYSMVQFLRSRPKKVISIEQAKHEQLSIWQRPVDIILIFVLGASMIVALVRGFVVLDCQRPFFRHFLEKYEPYLGDQSAYPKVQMLVYLFYFAPFYAMAIYGLAVPGQEWMPDWSLIHAGAAAQAQFTHIGSSLHHRTPYILRVPADPFVRTVFWTINLLLLIAPQLLAYRCSNGNTFFHPLPPVRRRRSTIHIFGNEMTIKEE